MPNSSDRDRLIDVAIAESYKKGADLARAVCLGRKKPFLG